MTTSSNSTSSTQGLSSLESKIMQKVSQKIEDKIEKKLEEKITKKLFGETTSLESNNITLSVAN
jgi:hypothetical protein